MAKKYTYKQERALVTIDCVVLTYHKNNFYVLLNKKEAKDFWTIIGTPLKLKEDATETISKEVKEKTGAKNFYITQLAAYAGVKRNPKERSVSISYVCIIPEIEPISTENKKWFSLKNLPTLGFDHKIIIKDSYDKIKTRVNSVLFLAAILPKRFTISQMQNMVEVLSNKTFDKRNFRKKIISQKIVEPLKELQRNVNHRAAQYYKIAPKALEKTI
ncbi:MAG: NUDIX hydrolase [Bacteroidetes bacterium]|nr:NUDIX hydrolase [Bacteroidota bacterium]